ncbi:putative cuticle protein, partial [Operophtera brumata]
TTAYPRNGFETTVTPLGPKAGYENPQTSFTGFTYPINGHNIQQEITPDSFGTIGHHLGKPGNIAIIAVPDVMQNYQPKAFGMYGGNPMIIKSYLGSPQQQFELTKMLDNYNENNPSRYLPTSVKSNKDNLPSFVLDATRVPLAPNLGNNPEAMQYLSTTVRYDKTKTPQNLITRNETKKKYPIRPKRPQAESDKNAELINIKNALTPEGYAYSFDTSNGIHIDESATTADGVKALGSYSYTGDDGKVYSVIYSADENGFQPRGDHFPTPPPIPEAIQMVIEQANKDKEAGIIHDGSYDEERYGHMKYQGPLNRYLKNKQRSYEMRNRKIVPGSKKMHKKTVAVMDTKVYNYQGNSDHGKNDQQSYVQNSVNNLIGKFGMKRVSTNPMNEGHANDKQNEEKKYFHLPMTSIEYQQDNNPPRIHKPSANEYANDSQTPKINKNRGEGVQDPASFKSKNNNNIKQYSNMATNNTYENKNAVKSKLDTDRNPPKMTTPQDAGYLYVPPRNIFIEGRFQDKPTILNEAPNHDKTYNNVESKAAVPVSQLYYIDQFDKNNNKNYQLQETPISKITSYITTTEEPIKQPTYTSDFYGSTNRDVDQSIEEERNASEKNPSKGNNPTITTAQPYGNTLSTNYNDKDYNDNIHQQEDNLYLDNRDENGFPSTRNNIENTSYQSTTQMPSHTKYTSQLLVDSNQYDTTYPPIGYDNTSPNAATNYPENEEYFRTSPDVPATFEDLPTSKYKAIYK